MVPQQANLSSAGSQEVTTIYAGRDSEPIQVVLRDRWLAAFLAWLVPGLGHLYQRRIGKGLLFFACVAGTFLYGMYLGSGRVVYASSPNLITRWQFFCQLGVGGGSLPALVQRARFQAAKPPLLTDFWRPPRTTTEFSLDPSGNQVTHPDELAKWNHDYNDYFELGTVFTVIAGLLNILVIYDAFAGPLVVLPEAERLEALARNKTG